MATTATPAPRVYHWVVCDAFASGPWTSTEVAQRKLEAVEALGACYFPHKVVPGDKGGPRKAWKEVPA